MAIFLGLLLAGCESARAIEGNESVYDPLETMNRAVFKSYLFLDKHAFRPAAEGYRRVLPDSARRSVRNFTNNLDAPAIFFNDVLRGRIEAAGTTLLRAAINSTAGIGGFFEVAEDLGFTRHSDDFGKTLAAYGVRDGPYLFILFLGPTNLRDLTGWVVDFFLSPFMFTGWNGKYFAMAGDVSLKALDTRERNIETLDGLERSSADFYATMRSAYSQARNEEIRRELGKEEKLPNF
jgi:phospholipid-binding lipoprotein MlaA